MPVDIVIESPNGAPPKIGSTLGALDVSLKDSGGNTVSPQYPIPTDGDSVYEKDVDTVLSSNGTFTGNIVDLFNTYSTADVLNDNTATATKTFTVKLKRPVTNGAIGLGGSTFSNVKIDLVDISGNIRRSIDDSANNTDYTSNLYRFEPVTFIAAVFTFSTVNAINLNGCLISKEINTNARIQGIRDDGALGTAVLDNGNLLRVNSFPYTYSIAEGSITGHAPLLKFGTRTTVTAGVPSTIWEGPTSLYAYLSTPQQLKISSTDNVNDNVGGTGALTLTIAGLDASWNEVTETITMTGTTLVTTTNSFIRVFRAYVATCGTSFTNTGTITVYDNAGTTTQAIINIGDGQTLMTLWTVPLGKVAYLIHGTFSTNSNKGSQASVFVRQNDGGTLYPWQIKYRAFTFSGNENFPFGIPFPIPEKTDIEVRVSTPVSAGATSCGSTFELWYEDV